MEKFTEQDMHDYRKSLKMFVQCSECQESSRSIAPVPGASFVQPIFDEGSIFYSPGSAASSGRAEHLQGQTASNSGKRLPANPNW
jgi:hypothetical protein